MSHTSLSITIARLVTNTFLVMVLIASLAGYYEQKKSNKLDKEIFAVALEASKTGRWFWDLKTNKIEWDEAMYTMRGLEIGVEPASYDIFIESIHPDDRKYVDAAVNEAIEKRGNFAAMFRIKTPEGKIFYIAASGAVSKNGNYMAGICVPHTDMQESLLPILRNEAGKDKISR